MPVYLDANGNPIPAPQAAAPTYLDPTTGEPIQPSSAATPDWRDKFTAMEPHGTQHTGIPAVDAGITALSNIGAGGLGVILHPVDSAVGAAKFTGAALKAGLGGDPSALEDQLRPTVQSLVEHPAETVEQGIGQGSVMGAAGEALPAIAGKAAQVIAPKAAETASRLYGSALKPSTTLSPTERASVVNTGLQQSIPVSQSGLEKLGGSIDTLNQAIKDEIARDPNRPIDPNAVATRVAPTMQRFSNQVVAQPDLNAIEAIRDQFLAERGAKPGQPAIPPKPSSILNAQGQPVMTPGVPAQPPTPAPPMAAQDAQTMKQGTYGVLRGKYGEQGSATVEAQKALARGLKEEIAQQFPEISNLNAQESKLLDLQPLLERAVNRISNHNIIGIGTPIAGGAAKAVTGSTPIGVIATVLKSAVDDPMIKSRLAIALSKASSVPYSTALSRIQAYSASLGATAGATQQNSLGASPSQSTNGQP